MVYKSMFSEDSSSSEALTLDVIVSKLTLAHLQLHLIHWQTTSYAQHKALGDLYEYIQDFKDDVVEKLMGYTGKRPVSVKLTDITSIEPIQLVKSIGSFAYSLYLWAEEKKYCDIENMAQELSGKCSKTLYLLTLM